MGRKTVYNSIVNEELYDKVNNENKELLEEFVEYLQSTGKSEGTIVNYMSDIKIYFIWNLKNCKNKEFTDITKRDIVKYQNWLLNDLKLSSSRVRRLRAALSSMSNFVEDILDDDFPDFRNIISKIPAPIKQPVREKTIFEDEDLQNLLDILTRKEMYQEACALSLAMNSGARKSELLRFKVDFFCDENIVHGSLYKTPLIKTKGRGGGKMLNKYVLANNFQPYLDRWLKKRDELGINCEYLLTIKSLEGVWVQGNVGMLDRWAEKFNKYTDKPYYWHLNRHYFTTSLAKANIPAEVIRQISGWETVDMVSVYNDLGIDDELGKYFDIDGIKKVEQKSIADL